MISYWICKVGDHTELERREEPLPHLEGNEMLVRMKASSFNRGDIMGRLRRHSADVARPAGADGSGEVVDPGKSGFKKGDRVIFRGRGCFAEYSKVDPGLAWLMPEIFTWEEGAAVPAAFITAWEGLIEYGEASAGNWVLLCGASSGVGVAALQIAKNIGCRVIVTSGSAKKIDTLKSIGADEGIVARGSAFVDDVMRITEGKGVDVSLNMVGGTAFPGCVQVAGKFGRVVFIGYVDGQSPPTVIWKPYAPSGWPLSGISNAMLTPASAHWPPKGWRGTSFQPLNLERSSPLSMAFSRLMSCPPPSNMSRLTS